MPPATPATVTPTTSGARTPRREATRARLLRAAQEVFAERGFHGASVEDICERARFTRGAFYSNYASKDDLVLELFAEHTTSLRAAIAQVAGRPGTSLEEVLEAVFDVWTGDPQSRRQWHLLTGELALHALRDPQAQQAWARVQHEVRRELSHLVTDLAEAQGLTLAVEPETLVRLVTVILSGGLGQHLLEPEDVPAGSLERRLLPPLISALTVPSEGRTSAR